MLSDDDFLRYSRQLLLEEIGEEGQRRLKHSTALIVGLGGLGSPVSLYLAAAGVGTLILADDDSLHQTNLQRQILFDTGDVKKPKAKLAVKRLKGLNPSINYRIEAQRIVPETLPELLNGVDLVIDCCDNMATRHAVNAACVNRSLPLISGSAVGFSGQLLVLTPPFTEGCYACLYPDREEPHRNCRTAGVLGPMVGAIGSLQALEAVKMLAGLPSALSGHLRLLTVNSTRGPAFGSDEIHSAPSVEGCMHITINDSPLELTEDVSLFDVLTRLNHPVQGVAVAVNHTIVPKTAWQTHQLHHGDSVLIFQAIAGG